MDYRNELHLQRREQHSSQVQTLSRGLGKSTALSMLALLVIAFLVAGVCLFCEPALTGSRAYAVTDNVDDEADELQKKIEESSAAYEKAKVLAEELAQQVDQNFVRLAELQKELPAAQERCSVAMTKMYKMQKGGYGLVDLLLNAEDLSGFITNMSYLDRVNAQNIQAMHELSVMTAECEGVQADLEKKKAEADQAKEQAETTLKEAQEARIRAQKEAQARLEAEMAARAAEEQAAMERAAAAAQNGSSEAPMPVESIGGSPSSDGANWTTDKQSFVNEWAPRIDRYLSGSPLGGQGATFASAAWDNGVDPRWSPAISCMESSKGRYCFLPHNAWGWGSVSWGSWEEAINGHIRGLARGYGYTISVAAAKKYCPPNWSHWFNTVSSEMNKI